MSTRIFNRANVERALAVMHRVEEEKRAFNMEDWQVMGWAEPAVEQESTLANCGTAACFAGWVAVSPEFQEMGGSVDPLSGKPRMGGRSGWEAIALWLGISDTEARELCGLGLYHLVYGDVDIKDVQAGDVVIVLERLLRNRTVYLDEE